MKSLNPGWLVPEARRRLGIHKQDPYLTREKLLYRCAEVAISAVFFSLILSALIGVGVIVTWRVFGPPEPITETWEAE